MNKDKHTAILLLSCPDHKGLVSRLSHFVFERGGNILDLDEHVDINQKYFFVRIAWDMENFSIEESEIADAFSPLAKEFKAEWKVSFSNRKIRVAIFVSKYDHCLQEILWRHHLAEFNIEIPIIISNHNELKPLADHYNLPFHVFPVSPENKLETEEKELT